MFKYFGGKAQNDEEKGALRRNASHILEGNIF
jgi:hypothetical protein